MSATPRQSNDERHQAQPYSQPQRSRPLLRCAACFELLHKPCTLACGYTVCRACVREPTSPELLALEAALAETYGSPNSPQPAAAAAAAASASLHFRVFRCPARRCRKRHLGPVSKDYILADLVTRLFGDESSALDLASAAAESLASSATEDDGKGQLTDAATVLLENLHDRSDEKYAVLQLPELVRSKILVAAQRFDDAIAAAQEAHRINPYNCRGIAALRIAELRKKEFDDARHNESQCADVSASLNIPAKADTAVLDSTSMPMSDEELSASMQGDGGSRYDVANAFPRKILAPAIFDEIPDAPADEVGFDATCPLCLSPLYDPITLKCGHTACRICLINSLAYTTDCGICRSKLPSHSALVAHQRNILLNALVEKWMNASDAGRDAWLAQIHDHDEAMAAIIQDGREMIIPLFICTLGFPGTKQEFHIFEARYRVMVKECLESSTPFGLCIPKFGRFPFEEAAISEYGTAVSIEFLESLADDMETSKGNLPRYYIQTKGRFRFRVLDPSYRISAEGLRYAKVARVDDIDPDVGVSEMNFDALDYGSTVLRVRQGVNAMFRQLGPARAHVIEHGYGRMPDDPALLGFWAAQWLPIDL
ncbi:hypothetical protein HDU83_000811 [Entophlyctis luteolus]|nr:hypothetical protein HDU83_000811 [Entophlyctis luteolus]